MVTAYLGIGSNIGDRKKNLERIIAQVNATEGMNVMDASSMYLTDPVGNVDQREFYNAVIKVRTSLEPKELLSACKAVEKQLKRKKGVKWGPRTADVDILLYGNVKHRSKGLMIPHKEMTKRAFVLVPLNEIDPAAKIPGCGTVAAALKKLKEIKGVRLTKRKNG